MFCSGPPDFVIGWHGTRLDHAGEEGFHVGVHLCTGILLFGYFGTWNSSK